MSKGTQVMDTFPPPPTPELLVTGLMGFNFWSFVLCMIPSPQTVLYFKPAVGNQDVQARPSNGAEVLRPQAVGGDKDSGTVVFTASYTLTRAERLERWGGLQDKVPVAHVLTLDEHQVRTTEKSLTRMQISPPHQVSTPDEKKLSIF